MNRVPKVSVIKVIEVRYTYGAGTPDDPAREVVVLFREDGSEIVTLDPCAAMGLRGVVEDAGGGSIRVLVDRDTMEYPAIGSRVIVQ